MNKRIAVSLLAVLAIVSSCNTSSQSDKQPADTAAHAHSEGQAHAGSGHIYSCPMHPEVTSPEPGTCPKCKMELVHTDQASNGKTYTMEFASQPTQPVAGQSATLTFTPRDAANPQALVPLELVHEKKIHLIVVSQDLSYFDHIHPDYQATGGYQVAATFPSGGEFVLFQYYTPKGATHQLSRIQVRVKGPQKTPVTYDLPQLSWQKEGYAVQLSFDKATLRTGESVEFKTTVAKGGIPVTDLENYLGALGHMVIISEDTKDFLHVHPMESASKGPDTIFHSSFDKPGIYRVFLQFNHAGKIWTADFTIRVTSTPVNS